MKSRITLFTFILIQFFIVGSLSYADHSAPLKTHRHPEHTKLLPIHETKCIDRTLKEEDSTMAETIISAEVEPIQSKSQQAALALQRLGLRVLHIGPTISVEGPQSIWEAQFAVSFETRKKPMMQEIPNSELTYQKALTESLRIPPELEGLIVEVMFVEPPELFGGS